MVGHWLQLTAAGVTALLAAFWIRPAPISPAMELVGDLRWPPPKKPLLSSRRRRARHRQPFLSGCRKW